MLEPPTMAKRHRTRARTRRDIEASRRSTAPAPAGAARESSPAPRVTHRPSRGSRTGFSRAAGAPSPALERAAVLERTYVGKDFRRLGLVVAIGLALLLVSGVVESVALK
jgi:hypothetical protein